MTRFYESCHNIKMEFCQSIPSIQSGIYCRGSLEGKTWRDWLDYKFDIISQFSLEFDMDMVQADTNHFYDHE